MKTVLVVDRDPRVVQILVENLRLAGLDSMTATNGRDALAIIRSSRPSLVITEIGLPLVHGLNVYEQTQADPATKGMPFIFLLTEDISVEILLRIMKGPCHYVQRPINPVETMGLIRELQQQYRLAA